MTFTKINYGSTDETSNEVAEKTPTGETEKVNNGINDGKERRRRLSSERRHLVLCIHGNKFGVATCCSEEVVIHEDPRETDSHCHPPDSSQFDDESHKARRKLIIASVLCIAFIIVEVVGGVLANSLAIATDAAHLLTDFGSFMVSLFSLWVASRPATQSMSFGYHRAEVIGAIVSVFAIWVVTGILVYMAVQRVVSMDFEIEPIAMLITSSIGVVVNIIMGVTLHQSPHGHTHGGLSHSHSGDNAPLVESHAAGGGSSHASPPNVNVRAAFIHVIGDFIQSLGVFIAALVIYFFPHLAIVDPICTFIFSVLVLATTLKILKDTLNVLMEGTPLGVNYESIQNTLLTLPQVIAVHNLRVWSLTMNKTALSAHLAIDGDANPQEILKLASSRIRNQYNIYEMTLQVEEFENEMESCDKCQPVASN